MKSPKVGDWVEIELGSGKKWVGMIQEWDEDALFITNGIEEGKTGFKGAECTNDETKSILVTEKREFFIE